MKTFVRNAVTASILAALCQAGSAVAEDVRWVSGDVEAAFAADDQNSFPAAPVPCSLEHFDYAAEPAPDAASESYGAESCGCTTRCGCGANRCCRVWTFDYEVRTFFNSHTSYEFGTGPGTTPAYAPLSKLDWDMDSTWHGLRVGLEKPKWCIHFEWLTPIENDIHGQMADYDWLTPANPSQLDSYTLSDLRWNDGQMLELGGEFKWSECFLGLPIEVWPGGGFRFQRLNMTGYGLNYVVPALGPQPAYDGVDVIDFNQQYYQLYVGGELRTEFCMLGVPIELTFQGDWAGTWGFNVDHHLLRTGGDRYTMENTDGDAMHLALIAETPITCRLSVGVRADHMAIDTTGSHRMVWPSQGADLEWDNGVKAESDQTSIAMFVRLQY